MNPDHYPISKDLSVDTSTETEHRSNRDVRTGRLTALCSAQTVRGSAGRAFYLKIENFGRVSLSVVSDAAQALGISEAELEGIVA